MQLGKENLKKFSPAGIHTHTHTIYYQLKYMKQVSPRK